MKDRRSAQDYPSGDSTDSALLTVARQYDPTAWERIVDRYSALVYHWCRRSGLDPEDAADVLQSVMLKLSQHLPRFEKDGQPAAFRRWLATVTRNCIRDLARANQDHPPGLGGTDALNRLHMLQSPCETGSVTASGAHFRNAALDNVLAEVQQSVEPSTWDAFRLTVFEHLTSTEVAEQLRMSPAAVRLAKARVLQRLRSRLENGSTPRGGSSSDMSG